MLFICKASQIYACVVISLWFILSPQTCSAWYYFIVYQGCLSKGHVWFAYRSPVSCDWLLSASPLFTPCPSNTSLFAANITQASLL